MTHLLQPTGRSSLVAAMERTRQTLNCVSDDWLALPLRLAVATVFWNSAMTRLANWDTAMSLFVDEYRLPLIPPRLPPIWRPPSS